MKYAIIDISSSSISLLAAEGEKRFDILFRERENVSILHYMEGKNLSERGVEKLVENLGKMKEICKKAGIDKCYVISTASMRNFENFEWVAEELKRRVAVKVNLLDGQEEAYCDLVSNERYRALDRAVLADIGGGSIELCDLSKNNPDALVYLDFGPIQINHRFVSNIHPTEGEAKDIKKFVRKKLEKSGLPGDSAFSTAVLVGATNQAIYDVYCDYYDEGKEGEKRIEYGRLKKLCKHLVQSSDRSMLVLKNAPEKIYTLTTAAVVLRAMLKYFGVSNIVVSDFGVKEGYLALVTDGRWQGVETDLNEEPAAAAPVAEPAAEPVKKRRGRPRKNVSEEPAKEPVAKKASAKRASRKAKKEAEPVTEKPATKRRGRPRKAASAEPVVEEVKEVIEEVIPEPVTEKPAAKRRGRPRKAVSAEPVVEEVKEVVEEIIPEPVTEKPAAKRRGRPRKAASAEPVIEEVKEVIEEVIPEPVAEKPAAKRRGRPRKAAPAAAAETGEETAAEMPAETPGIEAKEESPESSEAPAAAAVEGVVAEVPAEAVVAESAEAESVRDAGEKEA